MELSVKDNTVHTLPDLLGSENIVASSRGLYIPMNKLKETNLKDEYDPFGEDVLIELIIMEIDAGRL